MKQISRRNLTAIELSTAAGRHLPSPSPREARTGRGLGRGVSEVGQQPSSPRPSPPLVGGEGEVESLRRGLNSTAIGSAAGSDVYLPQHGVWRFAETCHAIGAVRGNL